MQRLASGRTRTARGVLQEATRAVHERLHEHGLFAPLLAGTIDKPTYCQILIRLYGFHKPLQHALPRAAKFYSSTVFALVATYKPADRIVEDLKALGCTNEEIVASPVAELPPIRSEGHLLGCLYVREGSTLGGRVLAGKLDHLLGDSTAGRQFFTGTRENALIWKKVRDEIERAAAEGHLTDMIDGACTTFAAFERWISGSSGANKGRVEKPIGRTLAASQTDPAMPASS
jgi:heme oxygenase